MEIEKQRMVNWRCEAFASCRRHWGQESDVESTKVSDVLGIVGGLFEVDSSVYKPDVLRLMLLGDMGHSMWSSHPRSRVPESFTIHNSAQETVLICPLCVFALGWIWWPQLCSTQ